MSIMNKEDNKNGIIRVISRKNSAKF